MIETSFSFLFLPSSYSSLLLPSPLLASMCLIVLDTHAASWSMTNSAPSEETSVTGALFLPFDGMFFLLL